MKNEKRPRRWGLLKWFLKIAVTGMLALAFIAAWLLLSPGRPDARKIEEIQKQRARVQAQAPAWKATPAKAESDPRPMNTIRDLPATHSQTASGIPAETDQQRCDRLFRELLECNKGNPRTREPKDFENYARYELSETIMAKAQDLAGFYEKSIRVSPEGRKGYHLQHGRLLGLLADLLSKADLDPRTELASTNGFRDAPPNVDLKLTDLDITYLLASLHFLRVTGCPAWGLTHWQTEANWRLGRLLGPSRAPDNGRLAPLPEAIATMDLELLAPRKLADWKEYLRQVMELRQDAFEYRERMTQPMSRLREQRRQMDADFATIREPKALDRIIFKSVGLVFSSIVTIVEHPRTIRHFNWTLTTEKDFLTYMEKAGQSSSIPEVSQDTFQILRITNEQLEARVLAGALELRRGRAIPKPEEIKPGDYLFDPVTRQPMRFYRQSTAPGLTRLYLVWPTLPVDADNDLVSFVGQYRHVNVLLPENHPGLETVPELKLQQALINELKKNSK